MLWYTAACCVIMAKLIVQWKGGIEEGEERSTWIRVKQGQLLTIQWKSAAEDLWEHPEHKLKKATKDLAEEAKQGRFWL